MYGGDAGLLVTGFIGSYRLCISVGFEDGLSLRAVQTDALSASNQHLSIGYILGPAKISLICGLGPVKWVRRLRRCRD